MASRMKWTTISMEFVTSQALMMSQVLMLYACRGNPPVLMLYASRENPPARIIHSDDDHNINTTISSATTRNAYRAGLRQGWGLGPGAIHNLGPQTETSSGPRANSFCCNLGPF